MGKQTWVLGEIDFCEKKWKTLGGGVGGHHKDDSVQVATNICTWDLNGVKSFLSPWCIYFAIILCKISLQTFHKNLPTFCIKWIRFSFVSWEFCHYQALDSDPLIITLSNQMTLERFLFLILSNDTKRMCSFSLRGEGNSLLARKWRDTEVRNDSSLHKEKSNENLL